MALLRCQLAEQEVRATRQIRLMIARTLMMSGLGRVMVILLLVINLGLLDL